MTPFLVEISVLFSQNANNEAGGKSGGGGKESWHNVVKLDHGNPNKPLSKCDQKLPIIFIVQEILSLQPVETNGPRHISDAFSFYKARITDRLCSLRLRLDVFIKPSG